ncbi:MAG: c-type cytochrome [Myxococcales bacterium]
MRTTVKKSLGLGLLCLAACGESGHLSRPIGDGFEPSPLDAGSDFATLPPPARLGDVITPTKRPPAISGGTLAVSADGTLAVASDPDRDAIYLVKLATKQVTTLQMPNGSEPSRVLFDARGQAHVVMRGTGELAHLDLAKLKLASSTRVCDMPRGVAVDPKSASLVVACSSGDVVWLSASDYSEKQRVFIDHDLRDVVVTNHALYVTRYRSAELLRLDSKGQVLARLAPPDSHESRFAGGIPLLPPDGMSAELAPQPGTLTPTEVTMSATLAWRSMLGPDDTVFTLHQRSQREEVSTQPGGYGGGCGTITQAAATLTGPEGPNEAVMPMTDATVAVDAVLSPDNVWLVVAAAGNYLQGGPTVLFYNAHYNVGGHERHCRHHGDEEDAGTPRTEKDAGSPGTEKDAGLPGSDAGIPTMIPGGCSFSTYSVGTDYQATAVAFDGKGKLYVQSREPATLRVYTLKASATDLVDLTPGSEFLSSVNEDLAISLNDTSAQDTGHDLFHANVGSGLACASCHGEALDDGHVWTFEGIGPRRTQNMRGGFLATAPFHWDGDLPTFKHLVDNVMTGRMGGFAVEQRYADALSGWIDVQPALKLEARDSSSVARGESLFVSDAVGCTDCHQGATLTNNLSADVGTGGMFQVPSLRGVGTRAPYMHDGCAKTLLDRFDARCGGDKHGKVSHLSQQDLQDLSAYLETL